MSGYREAYGATEHTLAVSLRARATVAAEDEALGRVRDARIARIAGGLTGILGVLAWPFTFFLPDVSDGPAPTFWLWGTVAASFLAWAAADVVLGRVKRPILALAPAPASTSSAEQAAAVNPWPPVASALWGLETWALALPMIAAAMLGPLFLHSLVWLATTGFSGELRPGASFAKWIAFSAMIVPHAHIAIAVHATRFARRLARMRADAFTRDDLRRAWGGALGLAVLCAAIPGIVLIAIPPVTTAATGLVLLPLLYGRAAKIYRRERAVVEALDDRILRTRVDVDEIEAARDVMYRVSPEPPAVVEDVSDAPPPVRHEAS